MWSLLWLLACSSGPSVTGVDPPEVDAGEALKVTGEGFAEGATVSLVGSAGEVALQAVVVRGVVLVEATVPEGAAPGTYDLVVNQGEATSTLAGAVVIKEVPVEVPCGGQYQANSQLSLARKVIVVDKFFLKGPKKGERETVRVELDDVERIEYELVKTTDDQLCSVIFVKRKGGDRVMFDDDVEVDLKDRAYRFATEIGRPVVVTREDAPSMGKPIERK